MVGGGLHLANLAEVTVEDSLLVGNAGEGSHAYAESCDLALRRAVVASGNEPGISAFEATVVVDTSLVIGNGRSVAGSTAFAAVDGDIHIVREGFSFHFPIVTCIVVSLLLSILFWILRR